ncbi:MAG: 16S rRNA (cytosine(967)-C(5))-methyltransferase RsmB [Gammaproteobacteria bacterium]|nr:16S rRNA (cytosine(967)-C(5))-methyltransferase RsmB [Gammaproteobacteria bacterium]
MPMTLPGLCWEPPIKPHNKKADARNISVQVLLAVLDEGESLSSAIPRLTQSLSPQDKAFAQMLIYGVLRWHVRLQALLAQLMKKSLKAKDHDVQLALLLGLYQLMDTRVPDYASVDATVSMIRKSRKKWAAGMVNGVLRNFIRQKDALLAAIEHDSEARYSHPQWIIHQLQQDWPEQWQQILDANNSQAPLVLRINRQKISPDDYLQKLELSASKLDMAEDALMLEQACDVTNLPGYQDGWFSVQDAGAQQAAYLLDLQAGQKILDCCAAPGGKTGHMLELQPTLQVTAMDISDQRLMRVQENLERLEFSAELVAGDAQSPDDWWDGELFDGILLDVPCSASGVIRRHPDIKSLRRADDIAQLVEVQQQILKNIWPLLKPGGKLLYVTCSVFKAENENQISWFLQQAPDAVELDIHADFGQKRIHGRQIFPGQDLMDGFYYSLLTKTG